MAEAHSLRVHEGGGENWSVRMDQKELDRVVSTKTELRYSCRSALKSGGNYTSTLTTEPLCRFSFTQLESVTVRKLCKGFMDDKRGIEEQIEPRGVMVNNSRASFC